MDLFTVFCKVRGPSELSRQCGRLLLFGVGGCEEMQCFDAKRVFSRVRHPQRAFVEPLYFLKNFFRVLRSSLSLVVESDAQLVQVGERGLDLPI